MTDEEESDDGSDNYYENDENDETDDYDTNQQMYIRSHFTLEEMKNIMKCIDQHPNFSFSSIQRRFREVQSRYYISRFRENIQKDGIKLEKLEKIKEFMLHEFYITRQVAKETVHNADLELYAIQKARELNWDTFRTSKSFIQAFKKEKKISA